MRAFLLLLPVLMFGQTKFNQIRIITSMDGTAPGQIEFDTSRADNKTVTVQAPTTATASYSLTLPIAAPTTTGDCLTGTTGGVLSFGSCALGGYWTLSGSDIYRTTGNVGIGTSSLSTESINARLVVVGTASQSASTLPTSNSNAGFTVRANASSGYQLAIGATSVDGSPYLQGLVFNGGSSASSLILQGYGGNVGVGTASPATESTNARLAVLGTASQTASTLATSNSNAGFTVRGNASSGYQLAMGTMATTDFPYIQGVNYNGGSASASLILQGYGGNVGIAVASPAYRLDISGTLNATGAATLGSTLTVSSHILTGSASASDIGDATNYWQTLYVENIDAAPAGIANSYLRARKFELFDINGSAAASWDQRVNATSVTSAWTLRDNGGSRALQFYRQLASSVANHVSVFGELRPAKRATVDGDLVSDSVYPELGNATDRWAKVWGAAADFSGAVIASSFTAPTVTATTAFQGALDGVTPIGSSSVRLSKAWTYDLSATGVVQLGASSTVGYVWKATDTAGTGGWAADSSGQWTTSGSDIYYTTGKAGIGTTAPRTTLSVLQSGTANTTADTLGPAVFTGPTPGSYSALLVVESNDAMAANLGGSIGFYGRNDATTNSSYFASIHGLKENGTSGHQAGYLAFKVRTAGNANPEVMRITSAGDVGIGATPSYKLDVTGTLRATGAVYANSGATVTGDLSFTGTLNTAISTTELGYLDGVTSAIQAQLGARALTSTQIFTTSPITGGGDLSTNRTFACATCFTTAGGTMTGNLVVNTNLSVGGDIFPSADLGADLGSAVLRFGAIFHSGGDNYGSHRTRSGANLTIQSGGAMYFDSGSSVDFSGTVTTGGSSTYSGTTSCAATQAVKTITVSRGLVTAVTCGVP